jgi:hypothetical protein
MAKPSTTGSDKSCKDEVGLLDVLRLLIDTKKARSTSDLLKYAGQYGAPEAEERLRVLEAENIPLDLAFDAVSVHLRLLAYKRNSGLVADCRGKKVGLILPLPPHVPELFGPGNETVYLQPDDKLVHGALHQYASKAVKGVRACRARAQEMQVLVFEAFRVGGDVMVESAIADVIEPKMLPTGIKLIAHLRPHRNPGDIALQGAGSISFI